MKKILGTLFTAVLAVSSNSTLAGVDSDIGSVPDYRAEKSDKDWSGMIGLAAMSAPEYWGSEDTEGKALPIIIVDYRDTAYFKVNRGGYWFWKPNESLRVGALVKIQPAAWEEDDDSIEDLGPLPADFDEPDTELEPGLNLRYEAGKLEFELEATSGEDTNVAASVGFRAIQTEKSTITLRLSVESLGEDTVNYQWYGDTSGADVDSATNTSLALIGIYRLNPKWNLIYGVKSTSLDDEIEDSPIVEEDTYTVGFFGAAWKF